MVPDQAEKVVWPSLGRQVCAFIEAFLVFGPGDLRASPAVLDEEQRGFIWRFYEVQPQFLLDGELNPVAGRRRFRRCALSLAKGLRKTELAAWIAAVELHPDGPVRCDGFDAAGQPVGAPVTDPYIPMVAYTEEQTEELAYKALYVMLSEGPLADDFDIGLERIMRKNGDGRAEALASSPSARDGARTTFEHFDETQHFIRETLKQAHRTMLANLPKRPLADPWALETTTAYEPGRGSIAEGTMDYARLIADGLYEDSQLFFYHREASDKHDMATKEGKRAAVIEASGPLAAKWRDIDGIVALGLDPNMDHSFWERMWCNRLVQASDRAFDAVRWGELARADYGVQDGAFITLGFDGARFHDSTALIGTEIATGHQFPVALWACPLGDGDWQVPEWEVDAAVREAFRRWQVWRMYGDPFWWESWMAQWSTEFGEKRVLTWNTNRVEQMANALRAFRNAILAGEVSHNGDETFAAHIGNCCKRLTNFKDEEGEMMWLIQKERKDSPFKIDEAMAAVLSWKARLDALAVGATPETVVKPYADGRPLLLL